MIGILSLILLLSIYFPIFYIFIKKRKKKIVRFVLIPLAVLFFPIFYHIICLNISYYHLEPFEGKVIVDLILDDMNVAIEVKGSHRIHSSHTKGLRALLEEHTVKRSVIVSLEKQLRKLDSSIEVLPWQVFLEELWSGELRV